MTDSDNEAAESKAKPSKSSGTSEPTQSARKRWLFKKIAIVVFLLVSLYLLSYGPAVTSAINQYGRTSPGFRTFYTPAGWLVKNSGAYHDYAMFWARHSRNYPWWIQNAPHESTDPLIPPRNPKSKLRFQEPPEDETVPKENGK